MRFTVHLHILVVLAQPPVARQPGEAALHDPALGQHGTAALAGGGDDHLQYHAQGGPDPLAQPLAPIALLHPDLGQAGKLAHDHAQQQLGPRLRGEGALVTITISSSPSVSTKMKRLRPVISLPPSKPRGPPMTRAPARGRRRGVISLP